MRARLLGTLVIVGALVAGCSSEAEEPQALPSVSPAASASPSPTPEAVPSAAQAPTPQGASAFARFWFETLNAAAASGDTSKLRALAHPACEACTAFADSIDFLHTEGGGIRGGVFTVLAAESPGDSDAAAAVVSVVYDVTSTEQLAKDGSVKKRVEALTQVDSEMTLVREGSSWLARELVTV